MVAHRGNLNYQDCRRTLTAGFEESDIELLREVLQPCEDMGDMGSSRMPGLVVAASSDMNTAAQAESAAPGGSVPGGTVASSDIGGSVPDVSSTTGGSVPFGSRGNALLGFLADTCTVMGSDMKDKKEHVRFRVKITSAFILTAEWWRTLSFVWSGTLEEMDVAVEAESALPLTDIDLVVDVTALRQYRVPGSMERCDVMTFVLDCFLGERRPKTRTMTQRVSPSITTCAEIPRFSERVVACILDFTGTLQTDDGEAVCIGNDKEHLQACQAGNPTLTSAKRCSYGWHDDQLTSAEYTAVVSREISANLDYMAEARRRPRPGLLHPTARDEKEDIGLEGEFVDAADLDDVHDPDPDEAAEPSALRPELQYKPILHVSAADLFDVVHRQDTKTTAAGRTSASTKRSREFLHQYGGKYLDMKESRMCAMPSAADVKRGGGFDVVSGFKTQKLLQDSRKEKEEQLMDVSEDEMLPGTSGVVAVPVDLAPEAWVATVSPAEMATQLLQQRLPMRQLDGAYEISKDQYSACVLAVAPLQKLWVKAGEQNLQHCFGTPHRIHEVLSLVTPATWLCLYVLCYVSK
ncbi:unnamed protein product [Durusdinium trenchii]|uniref:Uncharacterized protein n=1 Tax=Durusdinium trenchii TaxID=1381693 RepID=A0ABP0NSW5_9DINO